VRSTQPKRPLEFRVFEGPACEQMPKLMRAGHVPAGAAEIMRGRLEGTLSFDEHYDSGDAIIYYPDGRIKLVWDSKHLCKLTPKSQLAAGDIMLPHGMGESIDGKLLMRDEVEEYTGKEHSKEGAQGNPFWQWFARGDNYLLCEYIDRCFARVKERFGHDETMDVYVSKYLKVTMPVLRPWCFGGGYYCDSAVVDSNHIDSGNCRLVGRRKRTWWDILNTPLRDLFA